VFWQSASVDYETTVVETAKENVGISNTFNSETKTYIVKLVLAV
jgi:hypothetical protein